MRSQPDTVMLQVVRELKRAGYKPKMAILVPFSPLSCLYALLSSLHLYKSAYPGNEQSDTSTERLRQQHRSYSHLLQRLHSCCLPRWQASIYMLNYCAQASRSHYCIHKTVSKKPNLDEECETLLEDNSCKYFSNAQKLFGLQTSSSLQAGHLTTSRLTNSIRLEPPSRSPMLWLHKHCPMSPSSSVT